MDNIIEKVEFVVVDTWCGKPSEIEVVAELTNGEKAKVCRYFTDELSFTEAEFIGKTAEQAKQYWLNKDKQYIQS